MADGHPEIVIIKRHGGHEDEHHGGAWKIAFADFMTAMMAFFLVLWIINATDKDTKTIIARYFNPVKLEDAAKAPKGIRDDIHRKAKGQASESDAPTDGPPDEIDEDVKTDASTAGASGADLKQGAHTGKGGRQGVKLADAAETGTASVADPAKPKPSLSESSLFKDPYASLDEIAGKPAPPWSSKPQSIGRNDPITNAGTMDTDAFRDPFQPIARAPGDGSLAEAKTESSAAFDRAEPNDRGPAGPPTGTTDHPAPPGKAVAVAPNQSTPPAPLITPGTGADTARATQSKAAGAAPANSVDADSNHAGQSPLTPTQTTGTGERPAAGVDDVKAPQPGAQANADGREVAQLRSELLKEIGGAGVGQPGPGLEVQTTDEGLLISLTDQFDFSMFAIGSAEPQARVVHIMEKIAQALRDRPGEIVLRGYTDARPYKSATYDNWRLSSARAQMAYYMLVRGGLPEKRVDRIEGYADRRLKLPANPTAAENRRIEILLRRTKS
jgi:chemotaxis protein MotB